MTQMNIMIPRKECLGFSRIVDICTITTGNKTVENVN